MKMKLKLICALSIGVSAATVQAAGLGEHSPRSSEIYEYRIGGATNRVDPLSRFEEIDIADAGLEWGLGDDCGEFDPKISVGNQLNGITEGFKDMMSHIMDAATDVVASLPAIAIQRADPLLYDLLQQGILQGKVDFEYAKTSCEDLRNVVMGDKNYPAENFKLGIKASEWQKKIDTTGGDLVAAKQQMDSSASYDGGIQWACGEERGGVGQDPINSTYDLAFLGYNIMYERDDLCDDEALSDVDGEGSALYRYWQSPGDAANWLVDVVGNTEYRTCEGCNKRAKPGRGLSILYAKETKELKIKLEELVLDSTVITSEKLLDVSAPPNLVLGQTLIRAIRQRSQGQKDTIVQRLASEIAQARMFERVRFQIQLLRTGQLEPNVAGHEAVAESVRDSIAALDQELALMVREANVRNDSAKNTIVNILAQEEKRMLEADDPVNRGGISINGGGGF